jgi:hypothetical protein
MALTNNQIAIDAINAKAMDEVTLGQTKRTIEQNITDHLWDAFANEIDAERFMTAVSLYMLEEKPLRQAEYALRIADMIATTIHDVAEDRYDEYQITKELVS